MWTEYYSIEKGGLTVFLYPALGIVFCIVGVTVLTRVIRSKDPEARTGCALAFLSAWTAFAFLWTIGFYLDIYSKYTHFTEALSEHHYQVLEGTVGSIKNWHTKDGEHERVTIDSLVFEYRTGGVNPGFNKTRSHGGPMAPGKRVKLYHYEGVILKLWIRNDS